MAPGRRHSGKRRASGGGPNQRSSSGLVLAMLTDADLASALRQTIGREFRNFTDPAEVLDLVRTDRASVVVVGPLDACGRPAAGLVRELRAASSSVRIVVYGELTTESSRALIDLGRAGADKALFRGIDDRHAGWFRKWDEPQTPHITAQIFDCVSGRLDPRLHGPLRYCLDRAADPLTAAQVSSAVGVAPRTLSGWARKARFVGIRGLIMASKAAVAMGLVLELEYTVEAAALEVGFAGGSHLRGAVRRRTGAAFSAIRERRDLAHWCRLIFRANALRPA